MMAIEYVPVEKEKKEKYIKKKSRGGPKEKPQIKLEQKNFLENLCEEFADNLKLTSENKDTKVHTFLFKYGTAKYIKFNNTKDHQNYLSIYGKTPERHKAIKRKITDKIQCDLIPKERYITELFEASKID